VAVGEARRFHMNMPTDFLKVELKSFIVGISVGAIMVAIIGIIASHQNPPERYTIKTIADAVGVKAIKMDVRTGETWQMDRFGDWTKSE